MEVGFLSVPIELYDNLKTTYAGNKEQLLENMGLLDEELSSTVEVVYL